ncbi:MAG: cytochrome ubiquinol oxidase subunit I, partial [Actinobacteria bacterium]|nr:cytochrome ubiquinol oxidase subunit I [Actinomycetota bacterium]
RRVATYSVSSGWGALNLTETISAYVITLSMLIGLWNVLITLRKPPNAPADPWGGNTLEWATVSPPPAYNFDALPEIRSERPVRDLRIAISAAQRAKSADLDTGPDQPASRPDEAATGPGEAAAPEAEE